MESILNFIKEALEGKKMSASWIVTLGVAIGGVVWAGTLALQEYESVKAKLAHLEENSHSPYTYNDEATKNEIKALQGNLADATIKIKALEVQFTNLEKNQERTDRTVNSNANPLSL